MSGKKGGAALLEGPKFLVHRPEAEALEAELTQEGQKLAAVVTRLAWQLGLLRREIHMLTWEQVDFARSVLTLPDREVPMEPDMQVYLQQLQTARRLTRGPVVVSDRGGKRPTEQHLSYVTRQLLDRAGQPQVRLLDLRYDYILRQLEEHSWQYVSRVAGMDPRTLQQHFASHWDGRQEDEPEEGEPEVDPEKVRAVMEAEGYSAGGVAMRLVWELGLYQEELHGLRWSMVDWTAGVLHGEQRDMELTPELLAFLRELEGRNRQWSERILISDRAHRAVEPAHLSKTVRAALIRGGCAHLTLRDLRRDWEIRRRFEDPVLEYLRSHSRIVRSEVMALLNVTRDQANIGLKRMVARGTLVRSGHCYYLPGTVVAPEQQESVILAYLANHPGCRRQDLVQLLGLAPKQCLTIMNKLLDRELVERQGNRYYLKGTNQPETLSTGQK